MHPRPYPVNFRFYTTNLAKFFDSPLTMENIMVPLSDVELKTIWPPLPHISQPHQLFLNTPWTQQKTSQALSFSWQAVNYTPIDI